MNVYTTEEEQIEHLKTWIKNYGTSILIAVLIVIVGSFGWRYWRSHQETLRAQASVGYEQMLSSFASKDQETTALQANRLLTQYASTPYAKLAALTLAKLAVAKGDLGTAKTKLQWVLDNAKDPALRQIARIRIARILLAQKKPQQALQVLANIDDRGYLAMVEAVKGDVFVALGKDAEAKTAYKKALVLFSKANIKIPLLQMKLANLP